MVGKPRASTRIYKTYPKYKCKQNVLNLSLNINGLEKFAM